MHSTRIMIITAWLICASVPAVAQDVDLPAGRIVDEGQMQVGRYTTTVAAAPETAARPLDVYVQLSYPRQTVQTVGDAVRHTLLRTGWRLVEPSALAPQAANLLNLPLPESQRVVGPYRARTVLEVLTGPNWQWHEDPIQRLVWFTVKSEQLAAAETPVLAAEQVRAGDVSTAGVSTPVVVPVIEPQALPRQAGTDTSVEAR